MANPQTQDGYTRIANELLDQLCSIGVSGSELRIMLYVIRKTYGYGKTEDRISITQIQEATGLSRKMVAEGLNKLVAKSIIKKEKGKINTLKINKNYDKWVVTKRKLGSYENVTRVVTKTKLEVVTKTKPTKESKRKYTKEIIPKGIRGFGNPQINEVSSFFLEVMQIPKEDCTQKQSRQYWWLLIREKYNDKPLGVEGVKNLILAASKDEFYRNNITSSKDLYYKRIKLFTRMRGNKPRVSVMKGGNNEKLEAPNRDRTPLADGSGERVLSGISGEGGAVRSHGHEDPVDKIRGFSALHGLEREREIRPRIVQMPEQPVAQPRRKLQV